MWRLRCSSWRIAHACFAGWLSLDVHLGLRRRGTTDGRPYDPYIDRHLGCLILSFGVNPAPSG